MWFTDQRPHTVATPTQPTPLTIFCSCWAGQTALSHRKVPFASALTGSWNASGLLQLGQWVGSWKRDGGLPPLGRISYSTLVICMGRKRRVGLVLIGRDGGKMHW